MTATIASVTSHDEMKALVQQHLDAENAKDVEGAVAVYTDDVQHDVVGAPTGVSRGPEGARQFYGYLTSNLTASSMSTNHEYFAENAYIVEHQWAGTVEGVLLGIPGNGKAVDFRMLHVFEFDNGAISRENVWLDGGTIAAQLTA